MGLRPLARELGIAHTTLLGYETGGNVLRDSRKQFDVAEVIEYRKTIRQQEDPGDDGIASGSLSKSKARKEFWMADQAEVKAKKMRGEVIDRAIVESTAETIGSEIVTMMKNLAPKLRPHMSDAGRKLLDKEIDAALRDCAKKLSMMVEDTDDVD